MKPPHGPAFKTWCVAALPSPQTVADGVLSCRANRIMLVRPDIEVTTTHSYEIVYKYRWQCTRATCGKMCVLLPPASTFERSCFDPHSFSRHSNSINPSTHGCPCGSRIVPIDKDGNVKPGNGAVPSVGGVGGPETPKTERKKSKWVEFLQVRYASLL